MLNGGELAALYSFVFLLFVATGPGALSVDGLKKDDDAAWTLTASRSS
jgi:uncharacterized membrane protein YphA (DoxX/SURF4 family)